MREVCVHYELEREREREKKERETIVSCSIQSLSVLISMGPTGSLQSVCVAVLPFV